MGMKLALAQIPKGASRFHNTNQIAKYVYPFSAFIQRYEMNNHQLDDNSFEHLILQ